MSKRAKRKLVFAIWTTIAMALSGGAENTRAQFSDPVPHWIWSPEHQAGHVPKSSCYFRRFVKLPLAESATLAVAADDHFEVFLNGRRIGEGANDKGIATFDVAKHLKTGSNLIAIQVSNNQGATAGLAARLVVRRPDKKESTFVSDSTWRTSLKSLPLWSRTVYSDRRWKSAKSIGMFSDFIVRQQKAQGKTAVTSGIPRGGSKSSLRQLTREPASGRQLDVPREFRLEQLAGHEDVGSLTAMTFDEFGHIVAAREDGSLLLLHNVQGQFKSMREYGRLLKHCQGLLAMNGDLFAVGVGEDGAGLYRLSDSQGNGVPDKATAIVKLNGSNVEHGPHGLVLGADGLIYLVVGNHSGVPSRAAKSSPYAHHYEGDLIQPKVEDPGGHASGVKSPGGFVLRTNTTGSRVEVVAGGLRNAYDLAIDEHGEIFTHDSDMESDDGTPWMRPTRVYHVTPGAEFGWRSGWSKWPEYYLDGLPAIADTGRGSPTGMVFYDHRRFPPEYRHALFSCDWSEGRILAMKMREDGASFDTKPETFIQGEPLNVTDIEVGPDGGLYFCTGGRSTSGNIYRVTWKGQAAKSQKPDEAGIAKVLRQPQINSSWARQQIAKQREEMGDAWQPSLIAAAQDANRPEAERVRAVRVMHWMDEGPGLDLLLKLSRDESATIRRQAAYSLGMLPDKATSERLVELLNDQDAVVRRRACESLVRCGHVPELSALKHLFASSDRRQTWAARRVLERIPRRQWQAEVLTTDDQGLFLHGATAMLIAQPDEQSARDIIRRTVELMQGFINDENFTNMLRVQQLALLRGEIKPDSIPQLVQEVIREYPSSSQIINRELVRLLTYLQATSEIDRYLQELNSDNPASERAHLAIHLTRLKSGWTTARKLAVLRHLETESEAGNGLPGYLEIVARDFTKDLKEAEVTAILEDGEQWPRAAQAVLIQLPQRLSTEQFNQVKSLDQRVADKRGESLNRLKVAVVAVLARDKSPQAFSYLRQIYERDPARRVEVALGLAEQPSGENWKIVVRSLPLLDRAAAKHVLTRLAKDSQSPLNADPYRKVILTAQRLGEDGASTAIAVLEHWQGLAASDDRLPWSKKVEAWKNWYVEYFPGDPAPEPTVFSQDGQWDYESLLSHLTQAEKGGSSHRGKQVFVKAECSKCHRFNGQGESMGPDLAGISRRFLKREILESIVYPSKVVSDQYSAKIVTTVNGQTYVGIVARGGPHELSVLQSNGEKVRIPETEIDEMEPSQNSAMPQGTLDGLTLQEITDLFAYLASGSQRVTRRDVSDRDATQ